jgi:hypothetical protein
MSEFRMPAIRDLTGEEEAAPRKERAEWCVADLVLVRRDQVEELARTADMVDELPEGPGVLFVPFAAGYLGVPACAGADPGLTCWAMKGGVDDDPTAWVCVCRPPQSGSSSGWESQDVEVKECALTVDVAANGRLVARCTTLSCQEGCRLVRGEGKWGLVQFACACGSG